MVKKRVAYSVDTKNKAVEMKGSLSNSVDEEF